MNSTYSSGHGKPGHEPGSEHGDYSAPSREAGYQIFAWIRSTGLHRPDGGWAGGVFAALAQKLSWDSALVRGLGIVSLIIFTAPTMLLYGLAWLLLPDAQGRIHAQQAVRGDYTSGLVGSAILTVIGAINVFSPVNIMGPFSIILNLVILGVVAWVVYLVFTHWSKHDAGASSPDPGHERPGAADAGHRPDGKPAWYPKESAERGGSPKASAEGQSPASSASSEFSGTGSSADGTTTKPIADPRVREEKRRRRMVNFGLLLLAVPLLAGVIWLATVSGVAGASAVMLALAGVVVLLSLTHIMAALRGKRGRGGLLGIFTVLMLVMFSSHAAGFGMSGSTHMFGNYTTDGDVNTAFANSTVDLRHLEFTEEDTIDLSDPEEFPPRSSAEFDASVEINNGFANTTVIVPDGVYVEIDPRNFLSNLEVQMTDFERSVSGITTGRFGGSMDDPVGSVEIITNNAFGNVTVYDETTYELEENSPEVEPAGSGAGASNGEPDQNQEEAR